MKTIFFAFVFTVLAPLAAAQNANPARQQPCTIPGANNDFLGIQTIRLWSNDAPEAHGKACEDVPTLTILEPAINSGNGSAVIIVPGGAYLHLAGNHEGLQVASWFAARGFRAFVLSYRLSSHGYLLPVPLFDARRAIQTVRASAADYHINPNRIVLMGFSAGGHLAALAATQPVASKPNAEDPVERVSSRPDYLVLGYPWIGAVSSDTSHLSYCKLFNVMDQCEILRRAYSPEFFVSKDTPPTFWLHSVDDNTVPIEQGLSFFQALVKVGVSVEAHLYAHGGHGYGLGKGDAVLDSWSTQLENWLRARGLMTADQSFHP